ncbi:MAG: EthD domain-containing protein [Chloroflexi bacterium]|nr:EthD domain-containing protein [Chloroflexota bacterium]
MAKYIYLIRSPEKPGNQAFKSEIFDKLVPRLLRLNPEKLKIDLTEVKLPRLTVLPLKRTGLAMISVWDNQSDRTKDWQAEMAGIGSNIAGYQVTESMPVAYKKDWDDGKVSPGAVMLTLMRKNPSLSYEQFMKEWFGHHTPMAMRIHPLWNYIRNVVESAVIEGSPPMDGIVEEHCRSLRDITNPARYFGGLFRMLPNMVRVGLHANKFLQISEVENYLLTEYYIRS